jgi:very-short-patch-repair endonuclease
MLGRASNIGDTGRISDRVVTLVTPGLSEPSGIVHDMSDTPASPASHDCSSAHNQAQTSGAARRNRIRPTRLPRLVTLAQLLRYQDCVVSRYQALEFGLTKDMLRHRIRPGGPWQRLLPGVYMAQTGTPTIDQRETAAILYGGPVSVLTGAAALRHHGLPSPRGGAVAMDLLVPICRKRQSVGFVVVHRTSTFPSLVGCRGVVQYTLADRAVVDAARWIDDLGAVRTLVARAVQTRKCTIEQLTREMNRASIGGSALLRTALSEVALGVRSAPEAELMKLITRARLPEPLYNPKLFVGQELLAVPDVWWPEFGLVVEVDSKEWHFSPADWEATMLRHARLTALGIRVLHFSPSQIRRKPQEVIGIIRTALRNQSGNFDAAVRTVLFAA